MAEMSSAGKAAVIIAIIKQKVEVATNDYISASADLARAETGKKLWEENEQQQGHMGFSQAPYNVDRARARVTTTLAEKAARQKVLDYAIEVFISKIPDEKGD